MKRFSLTFSWTQPDEAEWNRYIFMAAWHRWMEKEWGLPGLRVDDASCTEESQEERDTN